MSEQITIIDYAREIGVELRDAYNDMNRARAFAAVERANRDLLASNIEGATRKFFWEEVERVFNEGPLRIQKTENSALHQLLRELEAVLEAKKSQ